MRPIRNLLITFQSDFRIGSGFGFAGVFDQLAVKNSSGIAVIPAASIKGKFRSACRLACDMLSSGAAQDFYSCCSGPDHPAVCKNTAVVDRCVICRLFGSVFSQGPLLFTDALPSNADFIEIMEQPGFPLNPNQSRLKMNIKMDRKSRTTENKMLRTTETIDHNLIFNAQILVDDSIYSPTSRDLDLLNFGARLITHMGAEGARGLGRCTASLSEAPHE